jgi:hypothetical protein
MSTRYPVCSGQELSADPDVCGIGVLNPIHANEGTTDREIGTNIDLLPRSRDTTSPSIHREAILQFHSNRLPHRRRNVFDGPDSTCQG